jgi:hypothetical protein
MSIDSGRKYIGPQVSQSAQRAGLVLAHQAGITDHVGGKYGGKPAFQVLSPSPKD